MEIIRKKVSATLWRGRTERREVIRVELNGILRGWVNYFAYGSPYDSFRLVDIHVADRVRNLMRRRHQLPRGTSRFGHVEVHEVLRVIEARRLFLPHAVT
jgi:hypothetical protein